MAHLFFAGVLIRHAAFREEWIATLEASFPEWPAKTGASPYLCSLHDAAWLFYGRNYIIIVPKAVMEVVISISVYEGADRLEKLNRETR